MSAPAVFLSYASQDAEPARRICEALRAAGIEVWFDLNELRGGDSWDKKIRTQIRDCALFLPLISANTQARLEGYFRLEWKLAEDRSHLMARGKPFLVPIVVDATSERDAHVPEAFLAVQWTRLRLAGLGGPAREGVELTEFCAHVQRLLVAGVADPGPAPIRTDRPAPAQPRRTSSSPPTTAKWSLAAVAVLTLAVAGYFLFHRAAPDPAAPKSPSASVPSPSPAPADKSLVVIPLENLSLDPENAFFTDGMHAEIISTLSRIPDLAVWPRDSAIEFKSRPEPLAEKAAKFGVTKIITGSVRRAGNDVRIAIELRQASDRALLWGQTYDKQLGEGVLAIQTDIADQVARVLQARERKGSFAGAQYMTKNPRAYDLFLQARRTYDQERLKDSTIIATLEEALRLDPNFMPAMALLATAHTQMRGLFNQDARTRALHASEAKRWAEAASRLMPGGAGDGPLAIYHSKVEGDHIRALAYAENVIRALPNESTGYDNVASILANLGRYAEAVTMRERALDIDPLNGVHWSNQVRTLTRLRRAPEAFAALARAQELLPPARTRFLTEHALFRLKGETPADGDSQSITTSNLWRMRKFDELLVRLERLLETQITDRIRFVYFEQKAQTHLRLGQRPEATKAAELALEIAQRPLLDSDDTADVRGMRRAFALALLGRGDEAIAAARRSLEAVATKNHTLERWERETELAMIYATLNRSRECVALLAQLLQFPSDLTVPMLRVDPAWDNVREDPSFKALLADPKNSAPL